MQIEFFKCSIDEVHIIEQIAKKVWPATYSDILSASQIDYMLHFFYTPKKLIKNIENGDNLFICLTENKPLGFLHLSHTNNETFIHKFYVDLAYQKMGCGSGIFQGLMQKFNNNIFKLHVNRQNVKAINFYFKNGFVIQEVKDFDIGNGYFMNDFLMIRNK